MSNTYWGGKREGAGRPAIGVTKQIKLTLPEESWLWLEQCVENGIASSRSEFLREIVEHQRTVLPPRRTDKVDLTRRS